MLHALQGQQEVYCSEIKNLTFIQFKWERYRNIFLCFELD